MSNSIDNSAAAATTPIVARLHRSIRDGDYEGSVHDLITFCKELLWKPNMIGWTALHFGASHGTPNLAWWRWMLGCAVEAVQQVEVVKVEKVARAETAVQRTTEDTDHTETQQQKHQELLFQSPMPLHLTLDDRAVLKSSSPRGQEDVTQALQTYCSQPPACTTQQQQQEEKEKSSAAMTAIQESDEEMDKHDSCVDSRDHAYQQQQQQQYDFCRTRTDLGHSCVDLFFLRHLHPLPWQRPEVHTNAETLKDAIQDILVSEQEDHEASSLEVVRDCIERLQKMERTRQQEQHVNNNNTEVPSSDLWLQPGLTDVLLQSSPSSASYARFTMIVDFWHRMELLLMAAHLHTLDFQDVCFDFDVREDSPNRDSLNRKRFRVVHALAHTGCPVEVAQLALALYPHQARERDENGNLPLHIAAASPNFAVDHDGDNDDEGDDVSPAMMEALLTCYPHAAQCADAHGRLPLNIALVNGKTWSGGINRLMHACPRVLWGRDIPTHMFSFMLASDAICITRTEEEVPRAKRRASRTIGGLWRFVPADAQERALEEARQHLHVLHVNTIFELLRASPDALSGSVPVEE